MLVVAVVSSCWGSCGGCLGMRCVGEVEAVEVGVEVVSGVGPVERCRGRVVAFLEADDPFGELVQIGEVGGGDGFPLQDREVDFHLV